MKKLIISIICSFFCMTLFAQTANSSMAMINMPKPKASLPVLETFVTPDVLTDIKQKVTGGDQFYDITAVKANTSNSTDSNMSMTQSWDYVVRVIRNGAFVTEKLDASGNQVS